MRYRIVCLAISGILLATGAGMGQERLANLRERASNLRASLEGFEEVPAVSTKATGDFQASIDTADTQLSYVLQYTGLSAAVTQGHIHFGARATNGGISIWLCGTATNPGPAGTPECPQSGTVIRTITAADVVGPAGQGISAGEFAEILGAIRMGVAYANVHSTLFPGGEIRGQIRAQIRGNN